MTFGLFHTVEFDYDHVPRPKELYKIFNRMTFELFLKTLILKALLTIDNTVQFYTILLGSHLLLST